MNSIQAELVVIGGGPGGYAAAFYAADCGRKVVLVEKAPRLGGVCLNHGCLPSKALLNAASAIRTARESAARGIQFAPPTLDLAKLRGWKDATLTKLAAGLSQLTQKRGVTLLQGEARFLSPTSLHVQPVNGDPTTVSFQHAIVATGSVPTIPASLQIQDPRVMTSTEALTLPDIPATLLVIGGGYIGMELGTLYAALGSQVTVVEALDTILAGADADLSRIVHAAARKQVKELRLSTRVKSLTAEAAGIRVVTETGGQLREELFDRVLVSVGRRPNTAGLGLDLAGIRLDAKGAIPTGPGQRTEVPSILAIGDVAGGVMLAHKAAHEARIAVDSILGNATGHGSAASPGLIPAVVFTDPEVAWVGLTEAAARAAGTEIEIAKFPWGASGRALTYDRPDGLTKWILEKGTGRILGAGIVGHGAGELIAEATLAIGFKATAADLAGTIHPHPTLSETWMEAADVFFGHATHVYMPKKPTAGPVA